jgi:acetolactate synthase-1/2/3 large subunit
MRFDDRVTGDPKRFAPNARIIHIEHDPAEIGKVVPTEVGLCGDALDLLTRLHHATTPCHKAAWRETLDAWRAADRPRDIITRDDGSMRAPLVMRELYQHVGSDVIVVTDVGQHQMWQAQYWEHERPRSLLTSGGLGTMGFALPAAIGAALSGRTEEIWVIAGDGGFQMTACELSTLSQEGLKLHIIILNNGFLGMVRQWQELFYERRYTATPMHNPDFCLLAAAHGIRAERVTERGQLAGAVAAARAHPGSSVIELCVTEEELVLPMVPAGNHIDDMIRRPQEIA